MSYPLAGFNGEIYTDVATGQTFVFNSAIGAWVPAPSPAGNAYTHEVIPVTAYGQTLLTLSGVPTATAPTMMNINGVDYWSPDWALAGNVVTWAGPVTLETSDKVVVSYTV